MGREVRRIALIVEYDGTNYGGWQRQPNAQAVQALIEDNIFKVTGERAALHGSGRTDSGVHALGQVAHFDTRSRMPADKFALALNCGLPGDIRVKLSYETNLDFHARFSAKRKHYRYTVDNSPVASALYRNFRLHAHAPLDAAAMAGAARYVEGKRDFSSFMAAGREVSTAVRTVYVSEISTDGPLIYYDITGDGFLYNMVRIIAGTLLEIGRGKYPPKRMEQVISARDRSAAGPTAPAHGLTLMEVMYDGDMG